MSHYIESIISLGFLASMMWGMLKFMLRDIHTDLSNIKSEISDIKSEISDIKSDMKKYESRIDHFENRIDRLYQMFVDLLKDRK